MKRLSIRGRVSLGLMCAFAIGLTGAQAIAQKEEVLASIPVPGFVGGGDVDSRAHRAYIPAGNDGAAGVVEVIDESSKKVVATIYLDTPWPATSAALNPRTGSLWVGAETGGLFEVDVRTRQTIGYVNVNAVSVTLNPETNTIYASDFSNTLSVVDGNTGNVVYTNSDLVGITNLVADSIANRVYIAMQFFNPGAVWVLDGNTNQIIAKAPAGSSFTNSVAVDPFRNTFYSADQGLGTGTATIYSSRTDKETTSIPIAGSPAGVAVDPLTRLLYVSDAQNNEVDVISVTKKALTSVLRLGLAPGYLTDDPVRKVLFVGAQGTDANGNPQFWIKMVKTK